MRVNDESFVYFVYPFLFEAEKFEGIENAVEGSNWPLLPESQQKKLKVWEKQVFAEDDLLPYVASYLNPCDGALPTVRLWRLEENTLKSAAGLGSGFKWRLHMPRRQVPFSIKAVQLALFRTGVGFLTIWAQPLAQTSPEWLDFVHYFRFVRGQRKVVVQVERRVGKDKVSPFFPERAGGLAQHSDGHGTFSDVIEALLRTGEVGAGRWWREVFVPGQLLPFFALFINDTPATAIPKFIYQMRNFFHAQQEIHPSQEDLRLDHYSLLQYAEEQWFTFSLDGGAFLACNPPVSEFFRYTLPDHLRREYFLLFLLALHQRFVLMNLSQQVSEHWLQGDETRRAQAFEQIRDALLDFTARGYFTQVMQREHHHRCYVKWQETFQIDRLYREVSDEVQDMHDYLQTRRSERLEWRLSRLGLLIGVPALIISFLGINLKGFTASDGLSVWKAAVIGFGGGLSFGLIILLLIGRLRK